jgi:cytoskeletal protein CcmA (bactofilin family)
MTTSDSPLRPERPATSPMRPEEQAFAPSPRGSARTSPSSPEECKNYLGPDADFNGTVVVPDGVRLEGTFKGEIRTEGTLQIVSGARVNAKVQADFAIVAGAFEGEIRASQRIDLLSTSQVQAKLVTPGFSVEPGASFDGQVEMQKRDEAKKG